MFVPLWCRRLILFVGYALLVLSGVLSMREVMPVLRESGELWAVIKSIPFSSVLCIFVGTGLIALAQEIHRISTGR